MCCQLLLIVLHTDYVNSGVSLPMYFSFLRKRNFVLTPAYKQKIAQSTWNY